MCVGALNCSSLVQEKEQFVFKYLRAFRDSQLICEEADPDFDPYDKEKDIVDPHEWQ